MIQNGDPIIIDMGDFSIGSYLFDVGLIYTLYGAEELGLSIMATKIPIILEFSFSDFTATLLTINLILCFFDHSNINSDTSLCSVVPAESHGPFRSKRPPGLGFPSSHGSGGGCSTR